MKKCFFCLILLIAAVALLTTGALAFDILDPPSPHAAEGWYEVDYEASLLDPSSNSWEVQTKATTVYEYNADGQPVKKTETCTYSDGYEDVYEYVYAYDSEGRRSRYARSDGNNEILYTYRADGSCLETYTWWYDDETPDSARTYKYTYDPQMDWFWEGDWSYEMDGDGWIKRRWTEDDEYVYTTTKDAQGRVVSVRVEDPVDHFVYTDTYTYTADGYSLTESMNGGYERFDFDAGGRLITYVYGYDETPYVYHYEYDAAGNCVCVRGDTHMWTFRYENPRYCFTDVTDPSTFFFTPVYWAVDRGITSGTSPTTFSPYSPCTRAQVVTFLWRAAGSPKVTGVVNPFGDVKAGAYYYDAVLWAVDKGVTTGTSPSTFSPEATCTRGQVVTFLWRNAGSPAPKTGKNPFADVNGKDYFCSAVLWAVEKGVTNGTSATAFSPNSQCQRSHVVTFLYRDMEAKG